VSSCSHIAGPEFQLLTIALPVAHRWLEEAYPNSPSIFRPEASLPIDVNSPEHLKAVEEIAEFKKCMLVFSSHPNPADLGARFTQWSTIRA
jgi:hypothetical protein